MAEPIAALIVRILSDTAEMVSGTKKATDQLDGLENRVEVVNRVLLEQEQAGARASGSVGTLTGTYRQFDGILQAVGINIGPQVKGLEDIANAAGKSATELGLVSTAGLAIGAGIAGWGVGRAIADFLDLDDAIAQAAASLLNYGNLAAETGGAKQDTINRAIAAGASESITYAKAIEFLIAAEQRKAVAYAVSSERMAAAQREVRDLNEATIDAIAIAQRNGATVAEITGHFHISADALRVLAERQREAARAAGEHTKEAAALQKSYEKLISDTKNLNQMAIFDRDADTQRRARENERGVDLMERDARLGADRRAFDDSEAVIAGQIEWERRYMAERDQLDRELQQLIQFSMRQVALPSAAPFGTVAPGFASVMSPSAQITINAQGSYWDSPDRINQMARMVEDAIAKRSGLASTYSRR